MTHPHSFQRPVVLLVQARAEPDIEVQEQACFQERARLSPANLMARNVVRGGIGPELLDGVDAVMIGGAGAFSATRDYPWTPSVLDLIQTAAARRLPTFGSCWGHQMIARALGGTVEHDPTRAEMGCHPVELTPEGQADPLFHGLPRRFMANMGHHDRVTRLPAGGVELAANASQAYQSFRLEGLPVYGTQFHSELDAHRERERLIRYRSEYLAEMPDENAFQRIMDSLAETTEVDGLLGRFMDLYVLPDLSGRQATLPGE